MRLALSSHDRWALDGSPDSTSSAWPKPEKRILAAQGCSEVPLQPIEGCDHPSEGQDLVTEGKRSGSHAMIHPVTSFDKDKREELGYILPL